MKTKNVKVRVEDIKDGRIIYTAHPIHGIEKTVIKGKPYTVRGTHSGNIIGLFVDTVSQYKNKSLREISLSDHGIVKGEGCNGRRSFFKLKHAEAWVDKWKDDKGFIKQHRRHKEMCKSFRDAITYTWSN